MANAVFTTKVNPVYDDLPEIRYHFPSTYLNQAKQAVGDLIVYYEPRRESSDLSGRAGRQCYFATARVVKIEPDRGRRDHYYAYLTDYLEFTKPVPFKVGNIYPEAGLRKADGSTNKGRFGRSVRIISPQELQAICQLGFAEATKPLQKEQPVEAFAEVPVEYGGPRQMQIMERPFRDRAFTRVIQEAYDSTCAMTGLKLINGGGRCEIEAAHIKPVADEGPDSPRNGIALSRTIHWMFDRHFLSISDTGEILVAKKYVPEPVRRLLNPDGKVRLPSSLAWQPHPIFLRYHRDLFKGD
ncbi:MAG TPA: HNH endonuclease [Verrucomicrobiae bacterium]|nr:HNH endonuclease [Verrucomicrobiae bacterium]